MTLTDSFLLNKTGTGHGEGKLYVGTVKDNKKFWTASPRCCFRKEDLIRYMDSARQEYEHPQQMYRKDITKTWTHRYSLVKKIKSSTPVFTARRTVVESNRYYITSDDQVWKLFRTVMLPTISFLSIFKLQNRHTGKVVYFFKPFLDYAYGSYRGISREMEEEKKIMLDRGINKTQRYQLIRARVGQGKFRSILLDEWPRCIVTTIEDPSLLIASHIKPWAVSDNRERLDPYNGLILTPTFDRLFDQGLISFEKNTKNSITIILSDHLGHDTAKKLKIKENQIFKIPNVERRSQYLEHHKANTYRS